MLRIIHPQTLIRAKLRDRCDERWKGAGRRASWSDLATQEGRLVTLLAGTRTSVKFSSDNTSPHLSTTPPTDNVFVQTLIIDFLYPKVLEGFRGNLDVNSEESF